MSQNKLINTIKRLPKSHQFLCSENKTLNYGELIEKIDSFSKEYSRFNDARIAVKFNSRWNACIYLACIENIAGAIFLQPSDVTNSQIQGMYETAKIDILITIDDQTIQFTEFTNFQPRVIRRNPEWILTTSGTSGPPKLAIHHLERLTKTTKNDINVGSKYKWGLIYELNRFAGLQVYFQALLSGSTLIISEATMSQQEIVDLFITQKANALSATPSFWRKLLMTANLDLLELEQITLGGEIANQSILNSLASQFEKAKITHIYASTEAGVGFIVKDGKEGFPLNYIEKQDPKRPEIKIINNELWIKNNNGAISVFNHTIESNKDGFINTGDAVSISNDRVLFHGRSSGALNVGGNKVLPEEIENVILSSGLVSNCRVYGKKSPILGTIVVAEIIPIDKMTASDINLKEKVRIYCSHYLEKFKVPAILKCVETIQTNQSGKIIRQAVQ